MNVISTISNNRTINKHGVKIAWALAVLCLLLVVLHSAYTFYQQRKIKIANYQPQAVQPIRQKTQQLYRANDIIAANLFGDPAPAKVVKVAPKTTLDLTLQGILWGTDAAIGRAIIRSGSKKTKLYSVGESIDGAGASVKEIRNGEVLLNRNGAVESLPLVKKTTSGNRPVIANYSNQDFDLGADDLSASDPTFQNSVSRSARPANNKITRKKKRSENGEPRKIRKPNFSGLDRALRKMGEL